MNNQDRLRFRVWDTFLQKFRNEIKINSNGTLCNTGGDEDRLFIVEQCTGLRDDKGVLIYEGDLCNFRQARGANDEKLLTVWREDKFVFVSDYGHQVPFDKSDVILEPSEYCGFMVIIGNIHEGILK